jgi:putative tryptophan/tyrosine transport system substrate-binding protein
MRRREFIALVGAATSWPLTARAQRPPLPIVGFMHSLSPEATLHVVTAFHSGLAEAGFVEGRNISIEYRWARGDFDRLPGYAAELVKLGSAVIVATGSTVSALAAKAATTRIPIVFTSGDDPVKVGLVDHMNRPGGNLTGVSSFATATASKRLELLRELLPTAAVVALLRNPKSPVDVGEMTDLEQAAQTLRWQIEIVKASSEGELEQAFAHMVEKQVQAVIVSTDPLFFGLRSRVVTLAVRSKLPSIYDFPENAREGGLMSYGTNIAALYRQVGVYTGKLLGGEKPSELPVMQPTRFDLVINLRTAKALGITVPPSFLARADEVIE